MEPRAWARAQQPDAASRSVLRSEVVDLFARKSNRSHWLSLALLLAPFLCSPPVRADTSGAFAYPTELEPDVRFWIRVYTEVTTDQGLLHDDWYLGLVYEVLRFDPSDSPRQREHIVEQAKARYAALLRRFAAGDTESLTPHERRILHDFGDQTTPAQYRDAIERIRFQLGQADRFHEGLIRAQEYEKSISRVLADRGVPPEIGALPHVESSFNPAAYSRVGAAGLWQFMPGTARRYMRVDGVVDQRLDPYSATEAAANLMLYNFRLLGSWPLAVTAYNHGPGGLRRAQDELGTSNIAVIVKRYQGATFGFASRNFYVAFLAALEVDRNAEKYFGPLTHLPETQSTVVTLPDYVAVDALARAFKADLGALRVLNPALRPPIWNKTRLVPRGYELRIPGSPPPADISAGWARLAPAERFVAQRNDGAHRARRGETLAGIAAVSGVTLNRLLAANGLSAPRELARGETVRIPMPASRAEGSAAGVVAAAAAVAATTPPAASVPVVEAPAEPAAAAPAVARLPPPKEPVSERQAESTALLPAAAPTGNGDTTDYSVGADNTVVVQAAETLGHLADWSKVSSASLRVLNRLHKDAMVTLGHKVKLDLSKVSAAQFESARRDYHRQLQESFFATHRISGTENYVVKKGESLWIIAQQHADLPVWLVAEYNPDVDFGDVRPGATIALPRVEAINRQ
jgi:membrane-bound lytic murein transglycosylase D